MIGIILAAGSGRRLGINKPKGLLNIYGKPLIQYSIDNLTNAGVNQIYICTGYKSESYVEYLLRYPNDKVELIHNDKYENCGSLYSLSIVLNHINTDDDIIILDSDIIYNYDEFLSFINCTNKNSILCTNVPNNRYDACYVKMDMHKLLIAISKNEKYAETYNNEYYEYIGITKVSNSLIAKIKTYIKEKFESTGTIDHEYDYIFENLDESFHCELFDNYIWAEADDDTQLNNLITNIYPKLNL